WTADGPSLAPQQAQLDSFRQAVLDQRRQVAPVVPAAAQYQLVDPVPTDPTLIEIAYSIQVPESTPAPVRQPCKPSTSNRQRSSRSPPLRVAGSRVNRNPPYQIDRPNSPRYKEPTAWRHANSEGYYEPIVQHGSFALVPNGTDFHPIAPQIAFAPAQSETESDEYPLIRKRYFRKHGPDCTNCDQAKRDYISIQSLSSKSPNTAGRRIQAEIALRENPCNPFPRPPPRFPDDEPSTYGLRPGWRKGADELRERTLNRMDDQGCQPIDPQPIASTSTARTGQGYSGNNTRRHRISPQPVASTSRTGTTQDYSIHYSDQRWHQDFTQQPHASTSTAGVSQLHTNYYDGQQQSYYTSQPTAFISTGGHSQYHGNYHYGQQRNSDSSQQLLPDLFPKVSIILGFNVKM
ncbi:hypothetical protein HDU96_008358, partial [Phlyctochytrium bullatum]